MDSYGQRQSTQWPPHLLSPSQQYPLPSPPAEQQYPSFYSTSNSSSSSAGDKEQSLTRASSSLSLNMSGLSVTSPNNLSPINPQPSNPITPISPPFAHQHQTNSFAIDEKNPTPSRKRSFSSTPVMEEAFSDSDTPMDMNYEEPSSVASNPYPNTPGQGASPVDAADESKSTGLGVPPMNEVGMLGKPLATNNFVTKLYQMINSPSSAAFISWTDLGTSFVVSNVGEFSRTILGSHFKHNNFSSFVRQLNMYGFHKINRTPRAQRTSTDAQTWEFSHHKFLRGRPDLLDEIKRKALEPDLGVKQRVELPGEVAAQLTSMRDENRRMWEQLAAEKRKVEKLVGVVKSLWDVVARAGVSQMQQFPSDLLESIESPNIYVTSPTSPTNTGRFAPGSLSIHPQHSQSMHSLMSSPGSSPTTADFPSHGIAPLPSIHNHRHGQSLSRQHSYQHISSMSSPNSSSPVTGEHHLFSDEVEDGRGTNKRQRMSTDDLHPLSINSPSTNGGGTVNLSLNSPASASSMVPGSSPMLSPPKKQSRARSDSAPLGYHNHHHHSVTSPMSLNAGNTMDWGTPAGIVGRPRSGSGMVLNGHGHPAHMQHLQQQQQQQQQHQGLALRSNGTPMLSITTVVPSNA